VVRIGPAVSREEEKASRSDAKKLGGGSIRTDTIQVVQLSHQDAWFHLFIPFSGEVQLSHEFASTVPVGLPTPLYFDRDGPKPYKQGQWVDANGAPADPSVFSVNKFPSTMVKGVMWDNMIPGGQQPVAWALQAVPAENRTVHLMHTAEVGIFSKLFGLGWYVERRKAFQEFAANLSAVPQSEPTFRHNPKSLLFMDKVLQV